MTARLDPREEHFRIAGPREGMDLFLRFMPAASAAGRGESVLYVHGATFPSALSVAHRFDGCSWRDALCDAGFDVWGLDFYGFGESARYPEMDEDPVENPPLCTTPDAVSQLRCAVAFVLRHRGIARLSLLAHSWGTMVAGSFAGLHADLVDRLVLFGPIPQRTAPRPERPPNLPAWRIVTLDDQWKRFTEDVPERETPVLPRRDFEEWGERYLDSDPSGRSRSPRGVKVPNGPSSDIVRASQGQLAYDPGLVRAPVAIIRGEWDGLIADEDARALFAAFARSRCKRDVKIGRATHLMHLEEMRVALWEESVAFLRWNDRARCA